MAAVLQNAVIRNSCRPDLAGYFQTLLLTLDWKTIFDHLIESTSSGAIDKEAFGVWVFVCQNADATVAAMAQNVSATGRRNAIKQFGRQLRTEAGFPAVRDAIGGVEGTLALMSQMSVNEVDQLCKTMRRSSTAKAAVKLRQEYMSALYHALRGAPGAPRNPDTRPLGDSYKKITPVCNAEIALWGVDFLHCTPGEFRYRAHTAAYEAHALAAMFPTEGEGQPVSAFTHLMERSRSFNMLVLQRVLRDKIVLTREEGESVIGMAKLLLRKPPRKNAKDDMAEQAMRLVVDCVQKHPVLADCIEITGRNDLVSSAIKIWRRAQQPDTMARLEESLVALVALTPGYKLDKIGFIIKWVEPVQPQLRFRLMHLLLLHTRHFQVDIESQSPKNDERIRKMEPWDPKVFFVLPAEQGLKLFEYMMKLRPDGSFLQGDRDTVLEQLRINAFSSPKRDAEWYERIRNSIAELKKGAASAREWQDRANMASSALSLCIEMESLDLYTDVVLWARRFRRDAQLIRHFYSTAPFYSSATLDLLSGIPLKWPKQGPAKLLVPIDEVRSNILKANEIMLLLMESASEALCEPSFRRWDWNSVLDLPRKTTQRRLDRAHEVQEIYNLDEKALSKNIWNPTIDLLIAFEKFGLKSGHERLELQQLSGPLRSLSVVLERPQPATYAFLNELAQKRDELWREFRLKDHPAIASLGSPWPQGLPVQFLCPETDWDHVSYVQSRSEKVVFVDGSVALQPPPEDEELREAIGPFVDGYMFALQVYIKSSISDDDRDSRVKHAWEHAVTNLSDGAMSEEEVPRFWRSIFEQVLFGRLKVPFPIGLAPILHDATYVDQSSICDILAGLLTTVKQVDIQIAAIDSLISMLGTGSQKNEGVHALVLDAIEHHVVHRAAALDEKQPMSSEDWRNAESSKKLPKVYDDGSLSTFPPILELLVKATGRWREDTPLRHEWVSRVLVPVAEQSAANNYRWTKMFVARHDLDIDVDSLPRLPVRSALLLRLFTTEPEFFTRANFETLKGYARIHLQVPDSMRLAKELVTDNLRPHSKDSNEAKHWLHQWPAFGVFVTGLNQIIHQLKKPPPSILSDSRPSPQELGAFVLEAAERILQQSEIDCFNILIGAVGSRLDSKSTWLANCLPLLEELITLPIKTRILCQKHKPDPTEEPSDAALGAFEADVAKLVDEFIDTDVVYHEPWPELKSSIMGIFEIRHYVRAALALAAPVPVDQMRLCVAKMLRLELADDMLRRASGRQDSEIVKQARTLLRGWVRSPIERLRSRGTATANVLIGNSKQETTGAWFASLFSHQMEVLDSLSSRILMAYKTDADTGPKGASPWASTERTEQKSWYDTIVDPAPGKG
ncbi:hypothetical protein DL770_004953 [Monosporascus sp. CRB-9-2]|nr:hypothetical protein DL770_004953 [Monosporascus sp. CRB-9-2]